jgi:hypothetical protein
MNGSTLRYFYPDNEWLACAGRGLQPLSNVISGATTPDCPYNVVILEINFGEFHPQAANR